MTSDEKSRKAVRRCMRTQRRALSAARRNAYAHRLADLLGRHPLFLRSRRIAFYLAEDGEMNLAPLLRQAQTMHKQCLLPVLRPHNRMLWFLPYTPQTSLYPNRFGILEPRATQQRIPPLWTLDLVLTPLTAFDRRGNRLGMGGGYYDRSFAWLKYRNFRRKPLLLGIAYGFQEVEQLPVETWDIPLWGVATEQGVHRFAQRSA